MATEVPINRSANEDDAMRLEQVPLVREFLADHKKMSKLMLHVLVSLEEGDNAAAVQSARELDNVAGPHIAYEESELYPRISGEKLISETTRELHDEHREAAMAVKLLLENPEPDQPTKQQILDGLRTGVHHAEHCGSLARLLAALPTPEQDESLAKLLAYRQQGRKWTDRIR